MIMPFEIRVFLEIGRHRGRLIQLLSFVTQSVKVGINEEPDYMIVLRMGRDGSSEEVYNGPGGTAWNTVGKMLKTGQRPISLSKLRKLNAEVPPEDRIPAVV